MCLCVVVFKYICGKDLPGSKVAHTRHTGTLFPTSVLRWVKLSRILAPNTSIYRCMTISEYEHFGATTGGSPPAGQESTPERLEIEVKYLGRETIVILRPVEAHRIVVVTEPPGTSN